MRTEKKLSKIKPPRIIAVVCDRNQLEEDYAADQISLKEYIDPFTGSKNK